MTQNRITHTEKGRSRQLICDHKVALLLSRQVRFSGLVASQEHNHVDPWESGYWKSCLRDSSEGEVYLCAD